MKKPIIALLVILALGVLYTLGHKLYIWSLDKPKYEVTDWTPNYQVRLYESYIVAEVFEEGDFDKARSTGFMQVGGYIFGGNETGESIKMTSPVIDVPQEGGRTIAFMIPHGYSLDDLPVPENSNVTLREEPAKSMAAVRLFGSWNEEKLQKAAEDLIAAVEADGLEHTGQIQYAYYDPPSSPWFARTTDVLLELTSMNITTVERLKDVPESASLATFSGGCFWCIETAFENQPGVYEAVSGFAGGDESTADYYTVASGQTDHREAVQVHYNADEISYEQLLEIFWRQIDPTDAGGQFADRGFHYTTAIYTHTPEQAELAEASKKALEESGKFEDPIVTEIEDYSTFFLAEEEHQDFAKKRQEYYQKYKTGSGRADYIDENWKE